jgi:hypothetical protein
VVGNDAFDACYQNSTGTCGKGPAHKRPGLTLDEKIQFTLTHELIHVLDDANPNALVAYGGTDEAMANEIADQIMGINATNFSNTAAGYWNTP